MTAWARILPRPLALAHTRVELPFAVLCLLLLGGLFAADLVEPKPIVVGILTLIPILTAVWLASGPVATAVAGAGFAFLILTGVAGAVAWFTVVAEVLTYAVTAVLLRLYALSFINLLRRPRLRPAPPDSSGILPDASLASLTDPPSGPSALTRRERDVARLAAQGYTAREIGERLFIGERTVETHLAHAYIKLGIRSKSELIRIGSHLD